MADLGRSAGYTLCSEGFGIAFCITEEVMDELFGPPSRSPLRKPVCGSAPPADSHRASRTLTATVSPHQDSKPIRIFFE